VRSLIFALALLASTSASCEEKEIKLKNALGIEKVEANCASCHSLDYIQMNSPFLGPEKWDAEITKMIRVMGAPISESDAKDIATYLNQNYGARVGNDSSK
jgi:mono/diheme cytochrome c family protein